VVVAVIYIVVLSITGLSAAVKRALLNGYVFIAELSNVENLLLSCGHVVDNVATDEHLPSALRLSVVIGVR
jgi:hypothetical protein